MGSTEISTGAIKEEPADNSDNSTPNDWSQKASRKINCKELMVKAERVKDAKTLGSSLLTSGSGSPNRPSSEKSTRCHDGQQLLEMDKKRCKQSSAQESFEVKKEIELPLDDSGLCDWSSQDDLADSKPDLKELTIKLEERARTTSTISRSTSTSSYSCPLDEEEQKPSLDREDLSLNERLREAAVSKEPSTRCLFGCISCHGQTSSLAKMQMHLRATPCGRGDRSAKYEIKTVIAYVCLVCHGRVLCDPVMVQCHLLSRHKMRVSDYRSKYGLTDRRHLLWSDGLQEIVANADVVEEISWGCVFKCPECNEKFFKWTDLTSHVSKTGHGPEKGSERRMELFVVSAKGYLCKLCGQRILCDRQILTGHLKKEHGMSPADYRKAAGIFRDRYKEVMNNVLKTAELSEHATPSCTFACPVCDRKFGAVSGVANHLKRTGHTSQFARWEMDKYLSKAVAHLCKICGERVLCEAGYLRQHFRCRHKLTLAQYNELHGGKGDSLKKLLADAPLHRGILSRCVFKCPDCSERAANWNALRRHFSKNGHGHRRVGDNDKVFLHLCIVTAVAHECRVCRERIHCDTSLIKSHLSKHGLRVADYIRKFDIKQEKSGSRQRPRLLEVLSRGELSADTIGNLCRYECPECSKKLASLSSFQHHFNKHHPELSFSTEIKYEALKKVVVHRCKLCSVLNLCDSLEISYHMKWIHKMSVQQYCKDNGCKNLLDREDILATKKTCVSYAIGDLCRFACNACEIETSSWYEFRLRHRKGQTLHHLENAGAKELAAKAVLFQCQLCPQKVLCDTQFIRSHLLGKHSMTVPDYEKQANIPDKSHYQKKRVSRWAEFVSDIPTFEALENRFNRPGLVPDKFLTTNAGNLCKYRCINCDKIQYNWQTLCKHMKKAHNVITFYRFDKDYVQEARYHKCLICSVIVLCDYYFLRVHLKSSHKMKTPEYNKMVVEKGGKVLENAY